MLTLIISVLTATVAAAGILSLIDSIILALIVAAIIVLAMNYFIGKHFMGKLSAIFNSIEKDLRAERTEIAIEKLKSAYPFAKWQFFVREQIDAQIGVILYAKKRFDEAREYLERGFNRHWVAQSMRAALAFREKDLSRVQSIMDKAIKVSKKEGFLYTLYAHFLSEMGEKDKAITVLTNGTKKVPMDDRITGALDALKNNKKIKMEKYGTLWMQLHLAKLPEGVKPYQMLINRSNMRRR